MRRGQGGDRKAPLNQLFHDVSKEKTIRYCGVALKTLRCSARELGLRPMPYQGRRPWTLQGTSSLDPLLRL